MSTRWRYLLGCLVCSWLLINYSHAYSLTEQRAMYDEAEHALTKHNPAPYRRYAHALQDYPLTSYLAYEELSMRLKQASDQEIEAFIQTHADLPQIGWMKLRWLRWLAARGEWSTFLRYYQPELNFTELDCLYAQHLWHSDATEQAQTHTQKLWLVGRSQPSACDTAFNQWEAQGGLTSTIRWQRALLAAESGEFDLVRTLTKTEQLAPYGTLLIEVVKHPRQLQQKKGLSAGKSYTADIISLGLARLVREDSERALELLKTYQKTLSYSESAQRKIARSMGVYLAKNLDTRALAILATYDPKLTDNNASEWRIRLLLRLERWQEAHQLISQLPTTLQQTPRWRYWRARTLQLTEPRDPLSTTLYQALATERDYFGFLAAQETNAPYQLDHQPAPVSASLMQNVRNTPAIERALEWYAREQPTKAEREWQHAARSFSREQLIALAKLAYEKQWYFSAIRTISQAQYWDDLEIRFPIVHTKLLTQEAQKHGLDVSWPFAITRQESAFMASAQSSAGARGLMQLMPATAKETGRRFGIALPSTQAIFDPSTNIALGAAYLSQLYQQFDQSRVLASAAYNAGPSNVRKWLKRNTGNLRADVWIESIPFDETRQYVQNVLYYSVIYGEKLNNPTPILHTDERSF